MIFDISLIDILFNPHQLACFENLKSWFSSYIIFSNDLITYFIVICLLYNLCVKNFINLPEYMQKTNLAIVSIVSRLTTVRLVYLCEQVQISYFMSGSGSFFVILTEKTFDPKIVAARNKSLLSRWSGT